MLTPSEHAARRTRRVPIASVISVNLESAILEHVNHSTSLEALPIARPPTPRLASPSTPASMARGSPDCPDGHHHTPAPVVPHRGGNHPSVGEGSGGC
ncbi:hypothetical protein AURDEDRAFT_174706 [Auricularia subglabra TFB-10046 SS5]|nr:hypothetical protein AURDEDRAFT_174706 [Auricularia subglabra TFB-10046 SS5]